MAARPCPPPSSTRLATRGPPFHTPQHPPACQEGVQAWHTSALPPRARGLLSRYLALHGALNPMAAPPRPEWANGKGHLAGGRGRLSTLAPGKKRMSDGGKSAGKSRPKLGEVNLPHPNGEGREPPAREKAGGRARLSSATPGGLTAFQLCPPAQLACEPHPWALPGALNPMAARPRHLWSTRPGKRGPLPYLFGTAGGRSVPIREG